LISSVSIGIPGFFLALSANPRRYLPGFLARVSRFVAPAGIVCAAAVLTAYGLARWDDAALSEARTVATMVLGVLSLWILGSLARPLVTWQIALVAAMAALLAGAVAVPQARKFFELDIPEGQVILVAVAVTTVAIALLEVGWRISRSEAAQLTMPSATPSR
jgi:cation-transporting ATPase E